MCEAAGLGSPELELRFRGDCGKRRWRFDLAWPDDMLAVEVEGGSWSGGRHTRGVGFENDCEKYATALCHGWRVLRVTSKQVDNGSALQWIERILNKAVAGDRSDI